MLSKESANEIFLNQFSYTAEEYCFSPGRINLIGEHIDYNGGLVLPFAINNRKLFYYFGFQYYNLMIYCSNNKHQYSFWNNKKIFQKK